MSKIRVNTGQHSPCAGRGFLNERLIQQLTSPILESGLKPAKAVHAELTLRVEAYLANLLPKA